MGERLAAYKLRTYQNLAGILYNPVSIHRLLDLAMLGQTPAEGNYTTGEVTFHHDFHSAHSATSKAALEITLNKVVRECREFLQQSKWLIITYGTAWVYRRADNGEIVANCHKQPSSGFVRNLLSTGEVESSFRDVLALLRAGNPELKVILTISPVRHLKDTHEGNSVSKSVLRLACENLVRECHDVFYFPAFEIMMDDLRDYRFYKADMIHPNDVAEEYIWEQFANTWFDDHLLAFIKSWKSIRQALQHRPFHPETDAHQQFLKTLLQRISAWSSFVNTDAEREEIMSQLAESGVAPRG